MEFTNKTNETITALLQPMSGPLETFTLNRYLHNDPSSNLSGNKLLKEHPTDMKRSNYNDRRE